MKKQVLLTAISLYGATLTAIAIPQVKSSLPTDAGRSIMTSILNKQQSGSASAQKATALPKRLIGSSYSYFGQLIDSNHYYYSNGRGSNFSNIESYGDLYYPNMGVIDTQFIKSDTSINWRLQGGSLQITNVKSYTYNAVNQCLSLANTNMGLVAYDITRNPNGTRATLVQKDTFGTGTVTPQFLKRFTYNGQGKLIEDSMFSYTLGMLAVNNRYAYDGNGNLTKMDTYNLWGPSLEHTSSTSYTYDASNRLTSTLTQQYDFSGGSGGLVNSYLDSFKYNGSNPMYAYHANYLWNSTTSAWDGADKMEYQFNTQGWVDTYYVYQWNLGDWDTTERDRVVYDGDGLMLNSYGYEYLGAGQFDREAYDTSTFYYEEYAPTSVSHTTAKKAVDFTIYPNPASNSISIQSAIEKAAVTIINTAGQVMVIQSDISATGNSINISRLPAGNYNLILQDNTGQVLGNKLFTKM